MSFNLAHIIKKCIQGDRISQKSLFQEYNGFVYGASYKYLNNSEDAKEICQDAWIEIFHSLKNYKEKGSFHGWVKTIIIRKAWKFIQEKKKRQQQERELKSSNFDPGSSWIDKMTCEEILKHLDIIPEASRMVFKLYVLDQLSHAEIASSLEITESTSRVHLTKARKILNVKFNSQNKISQNGFQAI